MSVYKKLLFRWYECARERVWKKFGGHIYSQNPGKRFYAQKGLLGYKVLIDGYNNTFEVPPEQLRNIRSGTLQGEKSDRYGYYSDEEREKLIQMKAFMKQMALDERRRAKQIAAINLQQTRRPPLLLSQTSVNANKHPIKNRTNFLEDISSSSELLNSQVGSSLIATDVKTVNSIPEVQKPSEDDLPPTELINAPETKIKRKSRVLQKPPTITFSHADAPRITSTAISSVSRTSTTRSTSTNKQAFQPTMSSADAFLISSVHLASEAERKNAIRKRELLSQIGETLQRQDQKLSDVSSDSTNLPFQSIPVDRHTIIDANPHISLRNHPSYSQTGPIKSHRDLKIRQTTFQPYERYASATFRSTAVTCLEEATYFKKKSWLKQVEMSKDMVKSKVQRRMGRADDKTTNQPSIVPLRGDHTTKPNSFKAQ